MKVGIIHYWLVNWRGGERVLQEICRLFPNADIFTNVVDPNIIAGKLDGHRIFTTFINRLPLARRYYKNYLPLMPMALEQLDLSDYDLIISSESGPAKGVITNPETTHVCYCHSPMRYIWNMHGAYRKNTGYITRLAIAPLFHRLRQWDYISATRVDAYAANSNAVASRIEKYYRRNSEVIAPPVDVDFFGKFARSKPDDFYLCCGELARYKLADHAVEAFNRMGTRLVVIGKGEMQGKIAAMAGKNVEILGHQPLNSLADHLGRCRALIFPGEEDFGIVPVEAMAAGRPVIAFGRGGVLDSVLDGKTGILYADQTVEGLITAVKRYEESENQFRQDEILAQAKQFARDVFRSKFSHFVDKAMSTPERKAGRARSS